MSVSICGLKIRPGDLLHGDENGLLKIPLETAGRVAEQAHRVRQVEEEFAWFVKSWTFSLEEMMRRFPE